MDRIFFPALLLSVIGAILGLIAFFGPFGNTGVDGTVGAGLALLGSVTITLIVIIVMIWQPLGGWRLTLCALAMFAAFLTAIAAFFLMQYMLAFAMALAFFVLIPLMINGRRHP
ncbi:hypothetical protein [Yoonia vestfoldensis]|uniref:hypothetical protein n=1 Tax=Yoonia vestfoldensis TaxID=245188 RepID=UPI00037B4766|nr:hypothetical protein [Yoonia vestfoldensis]